MKPNAILELLQKNIVQIELVYLLQWHERPKKNMQFMDFDKNNRILGFLVPFFRGAMR